MFFLLIKPSFTQLRLLPVHLSRSTPCVFIGLFYLNTLNTLFHSPVSINPLPLFPNRPTFSLSVIRFEPAIWQPVCSPPPPYTHTLTLAPPPVLSLRSLSLSLALRLPHHVYSAARWAQGEPVKQTS